jgi:hypothetical protein
VKPPKTFSDIELLEGIQTLSELVLADEIRISRSTPDEKYHENAQYWLEKRKPNLIALCQEYLRRNSQNGS